METTFTNCRILSSDGALVAATIVVKDEQIVSLHAPEPLGTVIDVGGGLVIPGVIDAHVHARDPGLTHKEDFASMDILARAGGVTGICDMPNTIPPTTTYEALDEKRAQSSAMTVRTKFFFGATDANLDLLPGLTAAYDIAGVKIFLGPSTGDMVGTYDLLARVLERFPGVVAIHAEDDMCVRAHTKQPLSTHDYAEARPVSCGVQAIRRAIELLRDTSGRLHICHVTAAAELALIRDAQREGLDITGEATPHHLTLTAHDTVAHAAYGKVNPPLRSRKDIDALWEGIADGTLTVIASDHAPHTRAEKDAPFQTAPAGMPGTETMVPVVITEALRRGVPLPRVIHALTAGPAERFGFGGGILTPGAPAHLTILDIDHPRDVDQAQLSSKCGWSVYHGQTLTGWPISTVISGQMVYHRS